jgi:cobalt-zinc-cadmium efflux system membrane fusion protein
MRKAMFGFGGAAGWAASLALSLSSSSLVTMSGCNRLAEEPAAAQASERSRDFVRLDPKSPRLDFIKVEVVKESDGAGKVTLPGKVTFDEDRTQRVASPIDGRATAILVNLGDQVRGGQALVQLSSPHVGQIQSDAQKALTDLGVAEKGIERLHKLQGIGAASEKEVAQAEGDYKKAKSDYARAEAQLKSLGISPSDPAVNVALRSQIPGVVVERNVLVGQEVRSDGAAPLLTISSLDSVWVLADAYEQDLGLVTEGAKVTIRVPAYPSETFTGKVKHIGDVVDPNSRTVKIRCVVANPGHRLKPEMFAKIDVETPRGAKLITVPSKAVLNDGDKAMVVVATEGNIFRTRVVQVGPEVEDSVRIVAGLTPGEKIVTSGAIFMKQEIDSR